MSYNLFLSKYTLEDETPIDDSSKSISSAYVSDDLFTWLEEKKYLQEINIKESEGEVADLPVTSISNENDSLNAVISHVEESILNIIKEIHDQTSDGVIVKKQIRNNFENLSRWLKIHEVLIEKTNKYNDLPEFLLILG